MRAVVQRVSRAGVTIDGKTHVEIGIGRVANGNAANGNTSNGRVANGNTSVGSVAIGYMVLLGIDENDTEKDGEYICDKLLGLRIFEDDEGKMNRSILDVGGEILLISQFTLYGDARKGRRPSFIRAARPEKAIPLYEAVIARLRAQLNVVTGEFGAEMQVELVNDGPVTILLDSERTF